MLGTLDRGNILVDPNVKAVTLQYASTTAGDQATPVLAAVAGKKIRVFAISATTNIGGTNFYLRNGAGGSVVTEVFYRAISGSPSAAYYNRVGYPGIFLYETSVGVALVLNCTTSAAQVSISLSYSYV